MGFDKLHRRSLMKSAVAGSLALATGKISLARSPGKNDAVADENQRQGTTDWLLEKTRIDPDTRYRSPSIEGYCSYTSIRAGEKMQFFVSTNRLFIHARHLSIGILPGLRWSLHEAIGTTGEHHDGRPSYWPPAGSQLPLARGC